MANHTKLSQIAWSNHKHKSEHALCSYAFVPHQNILVPQLKLIQRSVCSIRCMLHGQQRPNSDIDFGARDLPGVILRPWPFATPSKCQQNHCYTPEVKSILSTWVVKNAKRSVYNINCILYICICIYKYIYTEYIQYMLCY